MFTFVTVIMLGYFALVTAIPAAICASVHRRCEGSRAATERRGMAKRPTPGQDCHMFSWDTSVPGDLVEVPVVCDRR